MGAEFPANPGFQRKPLSATPPDLTTLKFLHGDADPNGLRIAKCGDLTFGAAPRARARELARKMRATGASVYLLSGTQNDRKSVREGEAIEVEQRLITHLNDPELAWFDKVAIITCDEMHKVDAQTVECHMARQIQHNVQRIDHQSTGPVMHTVPLEAWNRGAEIFLAIRSLIPILGIDIFETLDVEDSSSFANSVRGVRDQWTDGRLKTAASSEPSETQEIRPAKVLDMGDYVCAAEEGDGEWILLAGSQIKKAARPSARKWHAELRAELCADKILVPVPGYPDRLELIEDLVFGSLAAINQFVMGLTLPDCRRWRDVPGEQRRGHSVR